MKILNSVSPEGGGISPRREALFALLTIFLSLTAAWVLLELGLRLFYPQDSMRPRWAFSPRYCFTVYPGVRMVHERPGRWRFIYTINEDEYRGPIVPLSRAGGRPNVVVLGDSYSFGAGVNDGEEYPAVLGRLLEGKARVINLGIGGWGLTQEIRRYYDFGSRYSPPWVVLQFSSNDPSDNLKCPVTEIRDGRFLFRDTQGRFYRFKEILSKSLIQKSQLYNVVRDRLYRLMAAREAGKTREVLARNGGGKEASLEQAKYVKLLDQFVTELHAQGVKIVFLSANGQLEGFPIIAEDVKRLQAAGVLRYVDGADWLRGESDYASPEGHIWGAKAHRIIAQRLAGMFHDDISRATPVPQNP